MAEQSIYCLNVGRTASCTAIRNMELENSMPGEGGVEITPFEVRGGYNNQARSPRMRRAS